MNAKKIMGAVLVAFLAAALFIGAGAAIGAGETVFVYQPLDGTQYNGTWTNAAGNTITFEAAKDNAGTDKVAIMGAGIVEGEYTKGDMSIIVKYPTAVITGIAGENTAAYPFIGANLYKGDTVTITNVTGVGAITAPGYLFTNNQGVAVKITEDNLEKDVKNLSVGTYEVQVYFNADQFVNGTPANVLFGKVYTFNVVEAGDVEVTASTDSILASDVVKLTIVAKPGYTFKINGDFTIVPGQLYVNDTSEVITIPNTGKVIVAVTPNGDATGTEKLTVDCTTDGADVDDVELEITIQKGTVTAKTKAASYFVGDVVKVTGTSTAGNIKNVTIEGTNFFNETLKWAADATLKADNTFEFKINTAEVTDKSKKLDVGTYTITIATENGIKGVVALVLKQPFITIVEAPEVITQNETTEFIINAEAVAKNTGIQYYIFGTNYFNASWTNDTVKKMDNQFKITLEEEQTVNMSAGQYFMVIQHPMYDGKFNINATENTINLVDGNDATPLFNVNDRQTANAAQALCDALDSQNIDDMYVKYSFFVVGEGEAKYSISDIPATIAQGETLTISGVSTAAAGDAVVVEMISTAFAAVPKDTVGSAAFIVVTTTVAEDGTWEVTLDTSDLNVDEYSLSVVCEEQTWKDVKINVVAAADEPVTPEQPEQPENPENPTEPEAPATPGFGALAALAGLGAVAVLLLRRE